MPSPSTTRRALTGLGLGARRFLELAATPLLPADYLDLINPMRAGADLRGRVLAVDHETPTSTTVTIRPGKGWRGHRPGQYTRIGVDVNGVRHWRAYSITSLPGDVITISARAIEDGVVSNHLLTHLEPGTMIMLDQATGDFTLPANRPAPEKALFVTGGSGITPVMGILRSHLHEFRDVTVVHSAPDREQMMFLPELQEFHNAGCITLHTRFTRTEGILPVDQIATLVPDWAERETWACGPTGLLDDAEAHWAAAGLEHQLHTERFRPRVVAAGEGGEVTFATSEETVEAPAGIPILDVGEAAGVLLPSGCRMGICFNCVVPLAEGSVRDLRTGELTSVDPEDPQLIQTCISAAAGPCTITS
ncbi:MAG TPA: ferredoxin reductase [Actinomycetales bacterium]|nr:ferredoxin reductase [Actinomycetales bacterium]